MSTKRPISQDDDAEILSKLKEAFDEFDVDKNGSISKDELSKVFQKSGYQITEKALQSILKAVDSDQSGCINYEEFSIYYIRLRSHMQWIMDIQKQFKEMDTDHSGTLSREELRKVMNKMNISDAEVDEFIKEADTNKDGQISLQEWLDNFVGSSD